MTGSEALKITEKFLRENSLEHKKKRTYRVKFNPGLSANRPSNNWAGDCLGLPYIGRYRVI